MFAACLASVSLLLAILSGEPAQTEADQPVPKELPDAGDIERLKSRLNLLRAGRSMDQDLYADAAIWIKGLEWAHRYPESMTPADSELQVRALQRAEERLEQLESGETPWKKRKGKLVRGFVSAIDGSVQPFGLIIPAGYDPAQPIRLDVVLHGSSRPVGMSELRFMNRFDQTGDSSETAPEVSYIELHPLGRVENCYRWSGETDVFEAIEAVCRNYNIDRQKIVLRGMSMGASGTWHLGLKHPDRFVALGPYCGYVDTHQFSHTPLPAFVPVDELPWHQEKSLRMLDSIDYAANAGVVPVVACMGEKDVFFQAHELMSRAMEKEGLKLVNLISPGTGHVIDPVTQADQLRRIEEHILNRSDEVPRKLRFVTWTLKYGHCHWIQLLGLEQHYARAEISAVLGEDGSVELTEPINITRFAIRPPVLHRPGARLQIADREIPLPAPQDISSDDELIFEKQNGLWKCSGNRRLIQLRGKQPGVQGPVDDAFTTPFLCVRGTGQPWNAEMQSWADTRLKEFSDNWHQYFRGELPIRNDTDVTEEDARHFNLILFGDPGSNSWISRILPSLPLKWTREQVEFGGADYSAAEHAVIMIQPSPLSSDRYVVLNSGHTFGQKELSSLNYLLFPRHGDWTVIKIGENAPQKSGFFDEQWFPAATTSP